MEADLSLVAVGVEVDALAGDEGVELGEAVEVPVDERLVDVDPEGLCRLELGAVRGQVDEADALGHGEAGRVT